jgi:hypothetical protein
VIRGKLSKGTSEKIESASDGSSTVSFALGGSGIKTAELSLRGSLRIYLIKRQKEKTDLNTSQHVLSATIALYIAQECHSFCKPKFICIVA